MSDSAVGRVRLALDMAQREQERLNAFTSFDDEALARAAEIDARAEAGKSMPALAGLPVGLKDLIDHAGRITTCGSAFYRHRAAVSAPVVGRLEAAGAVVIGRTGLHEFAFGFSSENPHFGPVRNPWDPSTSTGGSSGGSAAAVAAGITPIGVGTDTGGSIRVPAALCGCFGLKTTHGRVPLGGVFPLVPSVDTVGPLADSIEGLEQAYRIMAADAAPAPTIGEALTIGVPQPWVETGPLEPRVAAAFEKALTDLRSMGHRVESVDIPNLVPPGHIWSAIAPEVTEVHREFREAGKPYGADVEARLADAALVGKSEISDARSWQAGIRSDFRELLSAFDFLATPTVPTMRKVIGDDLIGGIHYRTVLSWFTALVNQSLHPAIALPLADSGTPPVSIQFISQLGSELSLLAFGKALVADSFIRFLRAPDRPG